MANGRVIIMPVKISLPVYTRVGEREIEIGTVEVQITAFNEPITVPDIPGGGAG